MSHPRKKAPFSWRQAIFDERNLIRHFLQLGLSLPSLLVRQSGPGGPVCVIPGYRASDRSTFVLRGFLAWHGHQVYGWGFGINRGNAVGLMPKIAELLQKNCKDKNVKTALIGWSLGGYFAREVARDFPERVSQVITLGTPNRGGLGASARAREEKAIRVPITSIYSKTDRVVPWQASRDEDPRHTVRHIEVKSSHAGLGFHPIVYREILQALRSPVLA